MPNIRGGKQYKSGKHGDSKPEFHEIDTGQLVGRVLKHLGDRNILVYCNDGKERITHIRGGLSKKKAYIETGDIILLSLREDKPDRGDVLAKYDHSHWGQLKKIEGMNPNLFLQVENMDRTKIRTEEPDEGFEFEAAEEEQEEEEELQNGEEAAKAREKKKKEADAKRATARDTKYNEAVGDDFNIDDI